MIVWPYVLRRGHADDPSQGACAMDAINWLAHGRHGDAPECACPIITRYVIAGNDAMPDGVRQGLLPYLHRIAGSRSTAHEAARLRVLVLGAVRIFAPLVLDAADLHDCAQRLRQLPDDAPYAVLQRAAARAAAKALAAPARAAARAAALAAAADAVWAAAAAAEALAARAWGAYFAVLDAALRAGPEGDPWSADAVQVAAERFAQASA